MTGSKLIKIEDLLCDEDSFIPEEIFGRILRKFNIFYTNFIKKNNILQYYFINLSKIIKVFLKGLC